MDKKFDYVEWFRNDSSYPVIQKLEDYNALVSTNFTSRAELKEKNLHLKHVKFEDAAVYVCRTAVRHGEEKVSVQHGTFWKLIVKHEGESIKGEVIDKEVQWGFGILEFFKLETRGHPQSGRE